MNTDPETGKMVDKIKKAGGMSDIEKKQVIGSLVTKEMSKMPKGTGTMQGVKEDDMQDLTISDWEAELGKINDEITFLKIDQKDKESALAALGELRSVLDKYQPKQSEAVKEGVEEQSELILAAKDMMDKVTSFLEDLASMKTEGMLELSDRIRDEMGADKADAFLQKIQPAIEQAVPYTHLTLPTNREV